MTRVCTHVRQGVDWLTDGPKTFFPNKGIALHCVCVWMCVCVCVCVCVCECVCVCMCVCVFIFFCLITQNVCQSNLFHSKRLFFLQLFKELISQDYAFYNFSTKWSLGPWFYADVRYSYIIKKWNSMVKVRL